MKIPQLRMESQFAQIEISQSNARLEIRQEPPKVHIEQPQADVSIRTTPGRLTMDQTRAFEEMNLMSIIKRNDKHAKEGIQKLQEGTARRASEGKEMMQIENGGSVIPEQAKRITNPPMKQLGITFIPSPFSVSVNYDPAEVHIDVTTQEPMIQAEIYPPQFTYHPGHVETRLAQRNHTTITVEDE